MILNPRGYFPAARRCQRVAFSIFLCFFLRMRFRRFFISDPIGNKTLAGFLISQVFEGMDCIGNCLIKR